MSTGGSKHFIPSCVGSNNYFNIHIHAIRVELWVRNSEWGGMPLINVSPLASYIKRRGVGHLFKHILKINDNVLKYVESPESLTSKYSSSYKVFMIARVYLPLGEWHLVLIISSENWCRTLDQDSKENHFIPLVYATVFLVLNKVKSAIYLGHIFIRILNNHCLQNLHMNSCTFI